MVSQLEDIEEFEDVLDDLHEHFQTHPFHYGNENPVMPELYGRLRDRLDPTTVPVEYHQDHSNMDDWQNRKMFERIERDGHQVPRIRPEVQFYDDGILGGVKYYFDLAIFPAESTVVMQGKKEGIGNFIDADDTTLSVLCEIKHSMNMSS